MENRTRYFEYIFHPITVSAAGDYVTWVPDYEEFVTLVKFNNKKYAVFRKELASQ